MKLSRKNIYIISIGSLIIVILLCIIIVVIYNHNPDDNINDPNGNINNPGDKGNNVFNWRFDNWANPINWTAWNADKYMIAASQLDGIYNTILSKNVLQVTYPQGSFGLGWPGHTQYGGAQFIAYPAGLKMYDDTAYVRLEYRVMFGKGFDWVNGGKLPGLYGGVGKCTGVETTTSCFSTRYMWRAGGDLEIFSYVSKPLMKYTCGNNIALNRVNISFIITSDGSLNQCNPNSGVSIGRGGLFMTTAGLWTNLTQIVRMNTVGKSDGELYVWKDNIPVINTNKFIFRDSKIVKPNGIVFATFFGGGQPLYQTPKTQYSYWDGFSLSASYEFIWDK